MTISPFKVDGYAYTFLNFKKPSISTINPSPLLYFFTLLVKDLYPNSPMDRKVLTPPQHQVFINFRGDELRKNFISHLVEALQRNEINFFTDKQEKKGEDLSNLFNRIEESKIALAVFSKRYTESRWCLDELVKIKDRADLGKLKV